MVDVDPPVLTDDGLIVSCANRTCEKSVPIGTEIGATETEEERLSEWRVVFIPTDSGRVVVDRAECPEHRVDTAIDSLAEEMGRLGRKAHFNLEHAVDA